MSEGVERIAAERKRQILEEGYSTADDALWMSGELARAGACYAMPPALRAFLDHGAGPQGMPEFWPFDTEWWKPVSGDRVAELAKAGALIAAEIDRIVAGDATQP